MICRLDGKRLSVISSALLLTTCLGISAQAQSVEQEREKAAGAKQKFEVASERASKADRILAPVALVQTTPATRTSADKPIAFEVVSIRPDPSSSRSHEQIAVTPDGWHMEHGSFMTPMLTAFVPTTSDAMMYTMSTIVGFPDWVRTEIYDIDAKVPESDLAAWQNPATRSAMLRTMMQAMLADRCKLVVHRGSKVVPVYLLVVGKSGPKLETAVTRDPHPGTTPLPGGGEFLDNDGTGTAFFYASPIRALAVVLSNFAGRPVEDKTGLTGLYDMGFRRPHAGGPTMEPDSMPDPPPTIFEVVKGFGLKLEPAKSSVQTLVIDHIQKPSEN
jgi:bla regulator protein BlaR1